jgi:DNA primase
VSGSANAVYRVDTVQANRPVGIVEAPVDALSLVQEAGDLLAVVAAGTSWGRLEHWIRQLAQSSKVFLMFDADEGGETAAAWWQKVLGSQAQRWRPYWDDPNAML